MFRRMCRSTNSIEFSLVQRELDKQLINLILVQVVINIFTPLPHTIVNALLTNSNLTNDPIIQGNIIYIYPIVLLIKIYLIINMMLICYHFVLRNSE
jgi:hypothetical protein